MVATQVWTTLGVLDWTAKKFDQHGFDTPRLDAQVLLAHVLDCDKVALYTQFDKPLSADELTSYRQMVQRRLKGVPVAYLLGYKEFYSRKIWVDSSVLIPRPDTEILVERALKIMNKKQVKSVLDLCTGSAAIAIAVAMESQVERILATDICDKALWVAKKNVGAHDLGFRIELCKSDLF